MELREKRKFLKLKWKKRFLILLEIGDHGS